MNYYNDINDSGLYDKPEIIEPDIDLAYKEKQLEIRQAIIDHANELSGLCNYASPMMCHILAHKYNLEIVEIKKILNYKN